MKSILQTAVLIGGLTTPVSVYAENITLNFYALGIRAGTITVNGAENASNYSVKGAVIPTSLLKAFKDVGYSGSASGKRPWSSRFEATLLYDPAVSGWSSPSTRFLISSAFWTRGSASGKRPCAFKL